jgi:hypothetical protein
MTVRRSRAALAMAAALLASVAACAPTTAPPTTVLAENAHVGPRAPDTSLEPMSYLVNFRLSHPLGRAQALQNTGRYDDAQLLVAATMRDDAGLRGLCFERFTVGGSEIVLSVCSPSPWEERAVTQRRWLEQLGVTPGVAYVERNLAAQASAQ